MISESCMTLVHPRAFSERDPVLLRIHLVIHLILAALVVLAGQVSEHLILVEAVLVPFVAVAVPFDLAVDS